MATETIGIETDDEAADILATNFSSTELRALASNAGVSRERGDTMRRTAERIVAQDPALAARIIENDDEVDMDATAFREAREVGQERIRLPEAERRARSKKMAGRMRRLNQAMHHLPSYEVEVDWENGGKAREDGWDPGVTSVVIKKDDDWDGSGLAAHRGHAILRPTGRASILDVSSLGGSQDYATKHRGKPRRAWRMFINRVESFYDPLTTSA